MFSSISSGSFFKKSFPVLFFLIAALSFSCNKSDDNNCQNTAQVVAAAAAQYASGQTPANCQSYKLAIVQYLNSTCGATLSAVDKQAFENILNNLVC
ncbi:MAG: hypothetical protein ACRC2O_00120 [Chitinophagaceae bacterium]